MTRAELADRRTELYAMHLRKTPTKTIAEILGITNRVVKRDLKILAHQQRERVQHTEEILDGLRFDCHTLFSAAMREASETSDRRARAQFLGQAVRLADIRCRLGRISDRDTSLDSVKGLALNNALAL